MAKKNRVVIIIRWVAFILGAIFIFLLARSTTLLFSGSKGAGFLMDIFMPVMPFVVALMLLGSVCCVYLFVYPDKLPVFGSREDSDDPPDGET